MMNKSILLSSLVGLSLSQTAIAKTPQRVHRIHIQTVDVDAPAKVEKIQELVNKQLLQISGDGLLINRQRVEQLKVSDDQVDLENLQRLLGPAISIEEVDVLDITLGSQDVDVGA